MEFERSALRALAGERGWRLDCAGPGAGGIDRWAARTDIPAGRTVVLVGVAGSLRPRPAAGEAVEVGSIVDEHGGTALPSGRLTALPIARCLAASRPLGAVDTKRAEAARDRSDIVDLESAAFARVAAARGWRWYVVRGISDGFEDTLPEGIEHWTDANGRTRLRAVAAALLRRPPLARDLVRIGRASSAAMRAVAAALESVQPDARSG